MSFKLPNLGAMARSLAALGERGAKGAQKELMTPAELLLQEVQAQLSRPGTGRIYYGRGRLGSKRHQASAPGEPPAPDSRALLNSARIEQHGEALRIVVDGESGAARLEFGARDLAPRPYMRPSLSAARHRMTATFGAKLRRGRK